MYQLNLSSSHIPPQTNDANLINVTVGELLKQAAQQRPNSNALIAVDETGAVSHELSYKQLLHTCTELANRLSSFYKPGERIVVWAPNAPQWIFMEYACALAGLVLVTANPAFKKDELHYVLKQSGASALFIVQSHRGNPMAQIAAQAAENLPNVKRIVDLENPDELLKTGPLPQKLPNVSPNDPAQIQYTSGTTGFPKGAVLSHNGVINNARFFRERLGFKQHDVVGNFMPLFHTAGCAMLTLGALQAQCPMVLFRIFDPDSFINITQQKNISAFLGVPTMIVALVEALKHNPQKLPSIRFISSGGSMVAPELVRDIYKTFPNVIFQTVYGQTEASPVATQHHRDDSINDVAETAGQPLPHTEISIRDVQSNNVVPVGDVGEICIRGYLVMLGYHNNPDATSKSVDADKWLHTGDLGTLDKRGYLRITGRVKDMIIRGGENLFPVEIENILLEHPNVAECAVVGLPDPKWGEIVACFYRPASGNIDANSLHSHCRSRLAPQKTPVVWRHVQSFPLTGSGKIQKFKLREQFIAGEHPETP